MPLCPVGDKPTPDPSQEGLGVGSWFQCLCTSERELSMNRPFSDRSRSEGLPARTASGLTLGMAMRVSTSRVFALLALASLFVLTVAAQTNNPPQDLTDRFELPPGFHI